MLNQVRAYHANDIYPRLRRRHRRCYCLPSFTSTSAPNRGHPPFADLPTIMRGYDMHCCTPTLLCSPPVSMRLHLAASICTARTPRGYPKLEE